MQSRHGRATQEGIPSAAGDDNYLQNVLKPYVPRRRRNLRLQANQVIREPITIAVCHRLRTDLLEIYRDARLRVPWGEDAAHACSMQEGPRWPSIVVGLAVAVLLIAAVSVTIIGK